MEIYRKNRSHLDDPFDDHSDGEENLHEKTYVTMNADSFNERDFNDLLNCLDTIRESKQKRKSRRRVITNYCVQVPYVDNSIIVRDDDDEDFSAKTDNRFDRNCSELKSNISQMFSYFDEDVQLNYDDYDKASVDDVKTQPATLDSQDKSPECFREKFLRNQRKIKAMADTKPVIRGVIRKPNAPSTPNSSLNKNQVDKIMNEFNRVKINYYSKDNYVEFTDIDYAYCTSESESVRSERIGKLDQRALTKFQQPEADEKCRKPAPLVVPKLSVRDKISMFSQLAEEKSLMPPPPPPPKLIKRSKVAVKPELGKEKEKFQTRPGTILNKSRVETEMRNIIKNESSASKNQNKCFIKDINNSLGTTRQVVEPVMSPKATAILEKIISYAKLNDIDRLVELERLINRLDMSLLHTIDGLMNDEAFTLDGRRMSHLNVETRPSLERFIETLDGEHIDPRMSNAAVSSLDTNRIQLQLQAMIANRATKTEKRVNINVIFKTDFAASEAQTTPMGSDTTEGDFYILFTSIFEVTRPKI